MRIKGTVLCDRPANATCLVTRGSHTLEVVLPFCLWGSWACLEALESPQLWNALGVAPLQRESRSFLRLCVTGSEGEVLDQQHPPCPVPEHRLLFSSTHSIVHPS